MGVALLIAVSSACGTTVVEVDEDADGSAVAAEPASTTPTDAAPLTGDAAELLPDIGEQLRILSALVGGEGDPVPTLQRIEEAWGLIRDEIKTTRPELLNGLDASVEMARTSVVSKRPADADKAYGIFVDLIDAFDNNA